MSEEGILEITLSQMGNVKINVEGYLMVKDKKVRERVYWKCEYFKSKLCKGRAVTLDLGGNKFKLLKSEGHNHGAQASRLGISQALGELKRKAGEGRETPVALVQQIKNSTSTEVCANLPSIDIRSDIQLKGLDELRGDQNLILWRGGNCLSNLGMHWVGETSYIKILN